MKTNPDNREQAAKRRRAVLFTLGLLVAMTAIWFGTALLQEPPAYPTAKTGLDQYFDEHRMDYAVARAGLAYDVDSLVRFTDELDAGPFRVTGRSSFLKKANEIKASIASFPSEQVPAWKAFFYLQELAACLNDGHTTLYPVNWERSVPSLLPLTFTAINGRIFVKDNYVSNGLPERAELLAVDGVPVSMMSNALIKYVPGTLSHYLNANLAEWLGFFIQTYYRMESPWTVTYASKGHSATTTIEGITYDAYVKAATSRKEYAGSEFTAAGITVPILKLDFPGLNDTVWKDFKPFIDEFFARNMDKPYVVIDSRHNHGGDGEWMIYILSYLTTALKSDGEFSFRVSPLHKRIVRYGIESTYYDMHVPKFLWDLPLYKLIRQDDPYYWIGRGIMESPTGTFYFARWDKEKAYMVDASVPRFHGKVYLLISHETFSAGVYLAGLFRSNNLGTIVGRETGGRASMLSDMRPVFLPNSNLVYMVPVAKLVVGGGDPDRGIIPDVTVEYTPDDFMRGDDPDLETVRRLIKSDRAQNKNNH